MAKLNSKYLRAYGVVADSLGIDPLRDRIVPMLLKIRSYTEHQVSQDERGAPDLISYREYGSTDFWWYIMAYNGIARYKEIVEGLVLRIPEHASIVSVVSYADMMPDKLNQSKYIAI